MSLSVSPKLRLGVSETFTVGAVENVTVTHDGYAMSGVTLTGSTTVPVTKCSSASYSLVAGAKTIDLTALQGVNGTQDMSGLKLQMILVENPAGNSSITLGKGATNGYTICGTTNTITVAANASCGGYFVLVSPEGLPDVGSGAKTIDVSGSGTQSFNVTMVFG